MARGVLPAWVMRTKPLLQGFASLLCGVGLAACGNGASQPAVVQGAITAGAYHLDNPVIIATDLSGNRVITHVARDGRFALTLPLASGYRLALANTTAPHQYGVVSQINWKTADGLARFIDIYVGGVIDVGAVLPSTWATAVVTDGSGAPATPADLGDCLVADQGASETGRAVDPHHGHAAGGAPAAADSLDTQTQPAGNGGNGAGEEKVAICHIPPGNPANAHTIVVGAPAVPAHLAHGDYLGACLPETPPETPPCDIVVDPTPPSIDPAPPTPPTDPAAPSDGGTPSTPPTAGDPTGTVPGTTCYVNADCQSGNVCVDYLCGLMVF